MSIWKNDCSKESKVRLKEYPDEYSNINVECISSCVDLLMCPIVEISKYYIIFIYFQAAVSALLAVSVLYVEKNQNKYYVIF